MRFVALSGYVFNQSYAKLGAFWCHPATCCENKDTEWWFLDVNDALIVSIHFVFLIMLVDLRKWHFGIGLWGRMCVPYANVCFFTDATKSIAEISSLGGIIYSFKLVVWDLHHFGFWLIISADLFHNLFREITLKCRSVTKGMQGVRSPLENFLHPGKMCWI